MRQSNFNLTLLQVLITLHFVSLLGIGLAIQIEVLPNTEVDTAEAPHWRYPNLYYIDRNKPTLVRFDTLGNKTYRCKLDIPENETGGFVIPHQFCKNRYAVGLHTYVAEVSWDGKSKNCKIIKRLTEINIENEYKNNCINEGKCDWLGRIVFGTMNCAYNFTQKLQKLYQYSSGDLRVRMENLNISNSMAWNSKRLKYYNVDGGDNVIYESIYEPFTGNLLQTRKAFEFKQELVAKIGNFSSVMDALTIDENGDLYALLHGGYRIIKISTKTWNIVEIYELPCSHLTGMAFGGRNLDELFVVSAETLPGVDIHFPKPCGSAFRITGIAVKGVKEHECNFLTKCK